MNGEIVILCIGIGMALVLLKMLLDHPARGMWKK